MNTEFEVEEDNRRRACAALAGESPTLDGGLDAFARAQFAVIEVKHIAESTVGLLTASAFFSGAAAVLHDAVNEQEPGGGLHALIASAFHLDIPSAAGMAASAERLRARYQYFDDAHQAGQEAARRWQSGKHQDTVELRSLIHANKSVSMANLGQFGVKKQARPVGFDPSSAASSRLDFARSKRHRLVFWIVTAVLVAFVNGWAFFLLR